MYHRHKVGTEYEFSNSKDEVEDINSRVAKLALRIQNGNVDHGTESRYATLRHDMGMPDGVLLTVYAMNMASLDRFIACDRACESTLHMIGRYSEYSRWIPNYRLISW